MGVDKELDNSSSSEECPQVASKTRPVKLRREIFNNSTRNAGQSSGKLEFVPNVSASALVRSEMDKPFYKNESVSASEQAARVFDPSAIINQTLKDRRTNQESKHGGVTRILGGAMDEQNVVKGRGRGRVTNMDNKAFQEHNRLVQRRRKQMSVGGGDQGGTYLADVTFDETGAYLPISLPFLYKEVEAPDDGGGEVVAKAKVGRTKMPSTVFVDEANRNAAKILFGEDAALNLDSRNNENQWYILQTPSSMPPLAGNTDNIHMKQLESGYIGDLVIRSSGRIDIELLSSDTKGGGGPKNGKESEDKNLHTVATMDVNVGAESSFYQEVAAYNTVDDEFMFLGELQKKLVATPKVPAEWVDE